jgi:hypothetical protein
LGTGLQTLIGSSSLSHHHYPDQMALNCVIRHFQTHLDSYPGLSWEMRERSLDQIEDKLFKTGDKMIE